MTEYERVLEVVDIYQDKDKKIEFLLRQIKLFTDINDEYKRALKNKRK